VIRKKERFAVRKEKEEWIERELVEGVLMVPTAFPHWNKRIAELVKRLLSLY